MALADFILVKVARSLSSNTWAEKLQTVHPWQQLWWWNLGIEVHSTGTNRCWDVHL